MQRTVSSEKAENKTSTNKVYDLSYLDSSSEKEDSSNNDEEIIATANTELVYNQSTSSSRTISHSSSG
jgi:hypothetical protein